MKPVQESGWSRQSPYDRFSDFIAPDADRYQVLLECIETLKLNSVVISVAGNRHFFIFPPGQKSPRSSGAFPFRGMSPFMLAAHYDRVDGSPGANDNSIAVFHLLRAASILSGQGTDAWIIVFTDKEELKSGESFEAQGSFTLAEKLRKWGLQKVRIYNFDVCGCGNTFLFSTTTDLLLKDSERPNIRKVQKSVRLLRDHALETARSLRFANVLLVPTPFSDDMGFLRAGFAAQTITLLPANEAGAYETLLRVRPEFGQLIISGRIKDPVEHRRLPETWLSLNSAQDTPSRLTPEFFERVVNFAVKLCGR
ncbi:MAG: M28 family peptidase [Treponema sp.]|nr:M28 family peptidase [Treponema sp.]